MSGRPRSCDEDTSPELGNINLDNAAYYGESRPQRSLGVHRGRFPYSYSDLTRTPLCQKCYSRRAMEGSRFKLCSICYAAWQREEWRERKRRSRMAPK